MSDASKAESFLRLHNETQALLTQSQAENARLRAHVATLRAALEKYGRHAIGCKVSITGNGCTCGFTTALKETTT